VNLVKRPLKNGERWGNPDKSLATTRKMGDKHGGKVTRSGLVQRTGGRDNMRTHQKKRGKSLNRLKNFKAQRRLGDPGPPYVHG